MGAAACAGQGSVRGVTCQPHHVPRSDLRVRKGHPVYFLQLAPPFLVSSGKVSAWCLHGDGRSCGFETSPASMAERSNFFEGWWTFQVHWGTKYKGTDRHPIPTQSVLFLLLSVLMFSFPEELNS